jgi:hypothetical protein
MPRYRPDIDEDTEALIKHEVGCNGTSINKAASMYGVSFTLARQIIQGNRVKPLAYPPAKVAPACPPEDLCTCCNERPKKPGNHFLCAQCEREG